MMAIDVSDLKKICKAAKDIQLNFAVKEALKDTEIEDQDNIMFRCDFWFLLNRIYEKLKETSSLKFKLIANLDCLNPYSILTHSSVQALVKKMEGCLFETSESKLLDLQACNEVENEYKPNRLCLKLGATRRTIWLVLM